MGTAKGRGIKELSAGNKRDSLLGLSGVVRRL